MASPRSPGSNCDIPIAEVHSKAAVVQRTAPQDAVQPAPGSAQTNSSSETHLRICGNDDCHTRTGIAKDICGSRVTSSCLRENCSRNCEQRAQPVRPLNER